jgi:hypothetical protein
MIAQLACRVISRGRQVYSAASPAWRGYAEADYVKVAPVEQGLLTAISVARDDQIVKGAPLLRRTTHRSARPAIKRRDSSPKPKSS